MNNHKSKWPSRLCWGPNVLPKAGAFAWLEIKDKILIGMRLDRLITPLFSCIMCEKAFESTDHLLLGYEFAHHCQTWVMNKLGWSSPLQNSIFQLIHLFMFMGDFPLRNNLEHMAQKK